MKVVSFGEIMLRLSTPGFSRFVQAQSFDATYGGGEANVAVSLSNYGLTSYFVSKIPTHEIGQSAVNHLRRFGVDTRFIVRGGDRLGIYFLETGASQRGAKVVYDRAHSAVNTLAEGEVDWDQVFEGAKRRGFWFLFYLGGKVQSTDTFPGSGQQKFHGGDRWRLPGLGDLTSPPFIRTGIHQHTKHPGRFPGAKVDVHLFVQRHIDGIQSKRAWVGQVLRCVLEAPALFVNDKLTGQHLG